MPEIGFFHDSALYARDSAAPLRGTENAVARLAEALAARGHKVAVYNGAPEAYESKRVRWYPLAERRRAALDVAVSINKTCLFNGVGAPVKVLWSHNRTSLSRLVKKDGFWAVFRHRPHLVVLGDYHGSRMPRLLPFRSRRVLYHGMDLPVAPGQFASGVPAPRAVYTSVPYRGAAWVASLWPELRALMPAAELHIYARALPGESTPALPDGVELRGSVPREALLRELGAARVMLLPGHKDETFCMAASEATAMGVPIVTLGVGALRERVKHGVTGYIASSRDEFIAYARAILADDLLWRRLNQNCLEDRSLTAWDQCAEAWEQSFIPCGTTAAEEQPAALASSF